MKKPMRKVDQAKIRQRKHIAFRMNLLFFSIFILFSMLIFRLGYLQIVKGEDYTRELEKKEEIAVNTSVPRGRIYDRMGNILVDNKPMNAITYTKSTSTTAREMLEIAESLSELIEQDTRRVTVGDKRDFWILLNNEEAKAKVSAEEIKEIGKDGTLSKQDIQREVNRLTRERVTEEELDSFTDHELEVLAIYREMMSGYAYSPQIIKSGNVTEEEFAAVSERLTEFEGVDTTTDWERVKFSDSTILGTMTSPIEGIPLTHLDYYLARDYSRNDRIGRSYFEQYYEELLKGQKTIVKNIKDRTGRVVETKTVREGEPGKDLVLSMDSELQESLEKLLSDKLLELKKDPKSDLLDRAFLIMMDPNNGEVLSLVGKRLLKDPDSGRWEVRDYAYGTFTSAYEVGSTVKIATVLTGYSEGVLNVGDIKIDEPIYIANSKPKRSLFNQNGRYSVDDVLALGRSSNVYMFRIAMSLGNAVYRPNLPLPIDIEGFDRLRNGYASFGLGVKTEIDLPGEYAGQTGTDTISGKLLDFAIGQFDTYTPLQLAQYVSTVANGGYRVAPKILKEIREPSRDGETLGPLLQETKVKVLNRINNTEKEIEQVKKGMKYVYYGPNGTAPNLFNDAPYTAAGKTGTAQSAYYGDDRSKYGMASVNLTHVGFAPAEEPEVAYALVIPYASTDRGHYPSRDANRLMRDALDIYFDLKEKRGNVNQNETTSLKIGRKSVVELDEEDEKE
ncbi:penicillin-binding protein 2 [Sporosarcina thermotolerans]|uniref:Penicillin-binding protein 2 n=1 Tax=Sporosarcina thermotolerans TaxID=633404 RepID=A0AAW9A9Q8_9BACL|nr:penicillin-binding protein 2 [Sporosarcina thermotolerans]MDW0117353.1 penicillin-binding protein 2 [Sporosarcina thermotolerans]WHT47502.1 penicillin-binding protein 2 [Sporosarcina thermotolerans]